MANIKITDLDAYADPKSTDVLPAVDVTNDETKKVSIADLMENAGSGTEAAPGIAFDGDPNTGIYRPGADQLAISTAGTQRLLISDTGAVTIPGDLTVQGTTTTIDSETLVVKDKNIEMGSVATPTDTTADGGGITLKGATDKTINWVNATDAWTSSERFDFPAGTQAAPSIILNGDVDSGIYQPGADQVAISTGGSGRLFVDASGNVGIGASPNASYKLDVSGGGDAALRLRTSGTTSTDDAVIYLAIAGTTASNYIFFGDGDSSSRGYLRYQHSDDSLLLATAGSPRLYITSTGELKHIGGGSVGSPGVYFSGSAPSNSLYVQATTGNVGLGTASPDTLLTVDGDAKIGTATITFNNNNSITDYLAIGGTYKPGIMMKSVPAVYTGEWSCYLAPAASATSFVIADDGDERLRIDSSGNVGIGTASPVSGKKLTVAGDNATGVRIDGSTQGGAVEFSNNGTLTSAVGNIGNILANSDNGLILYTGTGNTTRFHNGSSEHARIDSNGTFRVKGAGTAGVTDAVQLSGSAPSNSLFIDGSGNVGLGTASPAGDLHVTKFIGSGIVIDGSNFSELSPPTSTNDAFIFRSTNDGTLNFSSRPASGGRAYRFWRGSNVSMIIDDSGNVGIGTTSPGSLGELLHVVGKARFQEAAGSGAIALIGANSTEAYFDTSTYGTVQPIAFKLNGDEKARIDSSGRLLVGTASALTNSYWGQGQIQLANNNGAIIQAYTYDSSSTNGSVIELHRARGTQVSPSNPLNNDLLGEINFYGYNSSAGTPFQRAAAIRAFVDGTPGNSATDMPGRLVFSTTPDGDSDPDPRMTIKSDGYVGIGSTNPVVPFVVSNGGAAGIELYHNASFEGIQAFNRSTSAYADLVLGAANIRLANATGEVARITSDAYFRLASSAGGIQFNGDTAAANALNDYEEGTFTPSLNFSGGVTSISYHYQNGRYVKIGNLVHYYGYLAVNTLSGASGQVRLSGFPFATRNAGATYHAPALGWYVGLATTSYGLGLDIAPNSTVHLITRGNGTGISGLTAGDINTTNFAIEWSFTVDVG
jgi:hypothetical protein